MTQAHPRRTQEERVMKPADWTAPPTIKTEKGCIDVCHSPDDGGWYAQEYDFSRKDNSTRTSKKIYPDLHALSKALSNGTHKWDKWD